MNRAQLKRIVLRHIQKKKPLVIAGGVGIGKTDLIYEIARELEFDTFVPEHLSQVSPVDVRGCLVPDREKGLSVWYPPARFPTKGTGIYFLDEIDKADQETRRACLQLLTERQIGGVKLGDDIALIGACNRPEDDVTAETFNEAFRSRVSWYVLDHDVDEWCRYASHNDFAEEVIGFMKFDPSWLHKKGGDLAMPTPRTWTRVCELWDDFSDESSDLKEMVFATVGQAAGQQLSLFVDIYRAIDVKAILEDGIIPDFGSQAGIGIAAVMAISSKLNKSAKIKTKWHVGKFLESLSPDKRMLLAHQVKSSVLKNILGRPDCLESSEQLKEVVMQV